MRKFIETIKKHIPTPKMISFNHAGIDIGSDHIRHISFNIKNNALSVSSYGTEKLPATVDRTKLLSENPAVLEMLRKIQKNFKYKYVEVSLPEELSYVYTQEVDMGDDAMVHAQIQFKIEENVPMKAEEAIFDYADVIELKNGKKLVSITVVSQKTIEDYIQTFKKASMEVVSFLVQNQALSKSLVDKNNPKSYCIVAIEKGNIIVSIVSSGIVLYTSSIKKTLFDDQMNLARAEILEEGIKEIYRIMIFWLSYIDQNKTYGFEKIESIIVASTHSNIIESEFIAMMINKLGTRIDKPNVWTNVFDLNSVVPPIEKIDSYQYATAIGLALPKLK